LNVHSQQPLPPAARPGGERNQANQTWQQIADSAEGGEAKPNPSHSKPPRISKTFNSLLTQKQNPGIRAPASSLLSRLLPLLRFSRSSPTSLSLPQLRPPPPPPQAPRLLLAGARRGRGELGRCGIRVPLVLISNRRERGKRRSNNWEAVGGSVTLGINGRVVRDAKGREGSLLWCWWWRPVLPA